MHGLMFIATFCWAGNIVAVKEGLTGFTPSALTQLRVAGAALVFAVIYFFRHGRPRLRLAPGVGIHGAGGPERRDLQSALLH